RLALDPQVLPELSNKRIVDISATSVLAGVDGRGELEERIRQLIKEVREAKGQVILFIDELHTFLRDEGVGEILANALKPALARGEFPLIGATTVAEYRRYIEGDAALARRFTPVWVEEPSAEDAIKIARGVVDNRLSPHHQVKYPDEVIAEAVHLSMCYIHDEFLPGKAIKILDQAGPHLMMGRSLRGPDLNGKRPLSGIVTVETIRAIISARTGIPLTQLSQNDMQRLQEFESRLQIRVRGQDEAIQSVSRVIKRARVGLSDPDRPLGIFLFAGPTGVGKTELALALANALFDDEKTLFRLDMSEFMEKHQVSRLTGSPPGYVGYEEEGQLTGRLRRHPYSVILFDEIEKAHKDVQNLFLQLFDAGRITDARGNFADGRNAIFIMTTNLGAKEALNFPDRESYERHMHEAIENYFSPEFISRISRVVYFNPLTEDLMLAIFDKFFAQAVERFRAQNIEVEITDDFKRQICKKYSDVKRGARPLLRGIDEEIIAPLTDRIISGEVKAGMKISLESPKLR
ncbi:MAG: ATP-dependent Clp protease ATP-binding subunit, partial [Anaerolineales bacterium]